jgi:hypothetical protein
LSRQIYKNGYNLFRQSSGGKIPPHGIRMYDYREII